MTFIFCGVVKSTDNCSLSLLTAGTEQGKVTVTLIRYTAYRVYFSLS